MKKYTLLLLILLMTITSIPSYCYTDTLADTAPLKKSSIRTYISDISIESWTIKDDVYVAIKDLERYGYDVIWIPEQRLYNITFDGHPVKNNADTYIKSQALSSHSLENSWQHSWFEKTYPISESIATIHGLAYSYGRTNHIASITFKRLIPESEFTREKIRVYTDGSFDVSLYFDYTFDPLTNTFSVSPNDDVIFKYVDYYHSDFYISIDASLVDSEGNPLTIPIHHGFTLNKKHIKSDKRIPNQIVSLSANSINRHTSSQFLYQAEGLDLIPISYLGDITRDDDEYINRLYITPKVPDTILSQYKRVDTSNYLNLITNVPVPNRTHYKSNAYATVNSSTSDQLASLILAEPSSDSLNTFINLIKLQDSSSYAPIINETSITLPKEIDSGLYALTFDKGILFGNGSILEENIYFIVLIN